MTLSRPKPRKLGLPLLISTSSSNGRVFVYLPRSFHGLVSAEIRNGSLRYSDDVQALLTPLSSTFTARSVPLLVVSTLRSSRTAPSGQVTNSPCERPMAMFVYRSTTRSIPWSLLSDSEVVFGQDYSGCESFPMLSSLSVVCIKRLTSCMAFLFLFFWILCSLHKYSARGVAGRKLQFLQLANCSLCAIIIQSSRCACTYYCTIRNEYLLTVRSSKAYDISLRNASVVCLFLFAVIGHQI